MHSPAKPLAKIQSFRKPSPAPAAKQTLQEWHAAGGGVPTQYKGREHVWHAMVDKFAKGGEVQMGAGGLLKGIVKGAQKGLATAPQAEALKLAQQRASLPPAKGGLGLPADNTPQQRAKAMGGKDKVHFSKHGGDYTTLDSGKFAIAPFDAVGTHVGTPEAAMERYQNTVGYKVNNPNYANDELKGATYPVTILGDRPMMNQKGLPFGEDELNAFLRQQGGHNWSDTQGGKMTYRDMNAKLRKKLFEEQGYTSIPYYNEVEGKGSISYIVPPDNIRSRFAAFDPFRRDAATAAAMGVLAPDLMAEEKKKAKGGEVHMAGAGDPLDQFSPPRYRSAGRRPESQNDRRAAANMPMDFARGVVSGIGGAPGDIESLVRMLPGLDERTVLPTSEDIEKRLPFKSDTPAGRAAAGLGTLAGGLYMGPGAPIRLVGGVPQAVYKAGKDFGRAAGQPATRLDVYHGSPHKFDRFDASKIGTGEGAQAYGHGLYLAESPDVAEEYATALARPQTSATVRGKSVKFDSGAPQGADQFAVLMLKSANGNILKAIENTKLGKNTVGGYFNNTPDLADSIIELLRSKQVENVTELANKNFYKVDLPDEQIAKMLDYDKHLSEQSPEVQKILLPYQKEIGSSFGTGEQTLKAIAFERRMKGLDDSPAAVSQQLRDMGIPGIKYLDNTSRGAGTGTRNFVTFPGEEQSLTILERNGQPMIAPVAEGMAGGGAPKQIVEAGIKGVKKLLGMADEVPKGVEPIGKLEEAMKAKQAPMTSPQGTGLPLMPRSQGMYIPGVKQEDLPRMPKVDKARSEGKQPAYTERMQDLLDSPTARKKVDKLINKGKDLDVLEWYGIEPLRQVAMNAGRTPEQFESLVAQLASASQRNPVDQQNKMGSYLHYLSQTGRLPDDAFLLTNKIKRGKQEMPAGTPIELPSGYGSLAQGDIFDRGKQIASGDIMGALPPDKKLGTFYRNYLGNLKPVTVDVNAVRGPIIERGDPRWLTSKLVEKDEEGNVIATHFPRRDVAEGRMSLKEAKDRPGFWEAAPSGSEYAGFEDLWQRGAKRHDIEPAEAQALGWYGSADVTALKTKPELYVDNLERMIRRTAEQTGRHPLQVMEDIVSGQGFLYKKGGAVHSSDDKPETFKPIMFGKKPAQQPQRGGLSSIK